MKRILVPTDFSPTAERAFRFAFDIAQKTKGTIILYHTYVPVESSFIAAERQRDEYNAMVEEKILKRLQRLKRKIAGDASEIAVSTIVGRSPLVANLIRFADKNHVDLIVMGTQGASGLKKMMVGSVAARVVEKSRWPILLVPGKYEWKDPGQLVFATNFSPSDKEALPLIDKLARLYDAETTVLHLMKSNASAAESEKEKKDFDAHARAIQKKAKNNLSLHFHVLEVDSIIDAMETLDKKFPYDVMIMVRRKKKLLEKLMVKSFTKSMAYVTRKPLLIIPEE